LDELPQLVNILKGEMSLVVPRPSVTKEIAKYKEYINDYYMVRPGLTGLWQVSGRNDIGYDSRVRLDSWYVRNWSFGTDMAFYHMQKIFCYFWA
jgi:lipopolysaccharide/colanic/teichoic acid biosynthesis glycosyltransferase